MNRLVKGIWKSSFVPAAVCIAYADEAGAVEMFEMPKYQDDLMCRLFDISKTHKALSYGCIPIGLASWSSCIHVCKDERAGKNGYDIDAELVEAIVLNNGGTIDYSKVSGKKVVR